MIQARIAILWMILGMSTLGNAQYLYPFQNPDLPVEQRIDNLLSLMTLDEKVACLGTDPSVPRLGVKGAGHVEGLHGLALGGPGKWGQNDPVPTTTFPQAIGLAASWDPELLRQVASMEAYETRYAFQNEKYQRGGLVVRAPNADIGRDPRWGRNEECYGEDAWFNGVMTVSFIKGLQGEHPKYWKTAALMKHFLANSNENSRDSSSSDFDERLLREYYAWPFYQGIVKGGSRAYMAAYNSYNGIPMTIHPILKEITVKEWGQNGIICTDGGAYQMLINSHKAFPDLYTAADSCLKSGINQFLDNYKEGVYGALANGYLKESEIEEVIRGVFRVMIKLGMLDPIEGNPYAKIGQNESEPWLNPSHHQLVRELTRRTVVLLKNDHNTLPLHEEKLRSVAVIGSASKEVFLDWYSGTPPYTVSALEGIQKRLGTKTTIHYAQSNQADSAVLAAQKSDWVILVVGNHPYCNDRSWKKCETPSFGKEAVDRQTLVLEEEELIRQVFQANPKTIVVLASSFPYAINWTQQNVPAILHITHNSQEMGNALADILFGDYNPGGKLVQTWPKSDAQLPEMMDYNIRNGRTYLYSQEEPLYPFGYGLSYTQFQFSNLQVSDERLKSDGQITVKVEVKNMGSRAGDEVVQLYVKQLDSKVERPLKELKGFKRVGLKPNEKKTVSISLAAEDLAYWNTDQHAFEVELNQVQIMVGSSSADIKLQKIIQIVK